MMMQVKLVVSNRHAPSVMTNDFSTHVERLILKTLLWLYCFVQKICFIGSFSFTDNYFFPFPPPSFDEEYF